MPTPLTESEQQALEHHLSVIQVSFALMVKSIAIIHVQRLYRGIDGNQTWAEFCKNSLNFSARLGHYFVTAFSILETIELFNETAPAPLPLPLKEAHTRALSDSPKELIIEVWQQTIARYGDNPTARNIRETIEDMTISEALIMHGVTDVDVLGMLTTLADKNEHGHGLVTELLNTGYLQIGDEDDAIPLVDVRVADLRRYQDDVKREAIARRVADEGGVTITIYPDNPTKTAGALVAHMPINQLMRLRGVLAEICEKQK
jgi:hypothetical protein